MLILLILFLQMGHLESQVANLSLTEQSWQQHACPHGRRTVLTVLSKQILHSSLTWYLASSSSTSGPLFSALEVEAALSLLGTGLAAASPTLDMEFCRRRGVAAWEIDWIINPAWTSKVSRNSSSGVLTSAACPALNGLKLDQELTARAPIISPTCHARKYCPRISKACSERSQVPCF